MVKRQLSKASKKIQKKSLFYENTIQFYQFREGKSYGTKLLKQLAA